MEFIAGGGFSSFQDFCGAPGYCKKCNKFVLANYLDPKAKCQDCGKRPTFYNDPSLQTPTKKLENVFSWNMPSGQFILPDTTYRCAKCGKFDLKFENIGNWD